jgi:hypothetical protein
MTASAGEAVVPTEASQVALERLVQALDLPQRLRVVWARVLELHAEALKLVFQAHLAATV